MNKSPAVIVYLAASFALLFVCIFTPVMVMIAKGYTLAEFLGNVFG
jgi:hypothetical protein